MNDQEYGASLPTKLWIDAQLRHAQNQGLTHTIIQSGDASTGVILLKIYVPGQGCLLMQQQRDLNGVMGWMTLFKGAMTPERDVDDFIERAKLRDSDLWIIEIEDKLARNPFEGKIF
jgi:hypothetical protein